MCINQAQSEEPPFGSFAMPAGLQLKTRGFRQMSDQPDAAVIETKSHI
jgi:hypothetical protein